MAKKNENVTERAMQAFKDGKGDSPLGGSITLEKGMKFVVSGLDFVTFERKDDDPVEYFALVTPQVNLSLAKFMGPIGSDSWNWWNDLEENVITKEAFKNKYNVKYRSPKMFAEKELPTLIGKTIEVLCTATQTVQPNNGGEPYEAVRVAWKVSK